MIYQAGPFCFRSAISHVDSQLTELADAQSGFFSLVRTRWILGKHKDVVDA